MASWTKMESGAWVVRCMRTQAVVGSTIEVERKDGTRSTEVIERVVWQGTTEDVALCAVVQRPRETGVERPRSVVERPRPTRPTRRTCSNCGEALSGWAAQRGYRTCRECAHGGASYTDQHGRFVLGSDD